MNYDRDEAVAVARMLRGTSHVLAADVLESAIAEVDALRFDAEAVLVCPGCHAVAPDECAPGCIDEEMRREREEPRDDDLGGEEDDDA